MAEYKQTLSQIIAKLNQLEVQSQQINNDILQLKAEIDNLKSIENTIQFDEVHVSRSKSNDSETNLIGNEFVLEQNKPISSNPIISDETKSHKAWFGDYFNKKTFNFEKFIGENLINKIGILIIIIGVFIGAKYAIDHQLISPLTRIVFGYISGLVLLILALKLKVKYQNFSAVLLSGSMAIFYFITFISYSFYQLIPQELAFILMLCFTVFTVIASWHYNMQIIAIIALVAAYSVPYLLSDGSGQIVVFFSYMSIINTGILIVSIQKYWKALLWSSFISTWFIATIWYGFSFDSTIHFGIALLFFSIFFILFYSTFLFYKLFKNELFNSLDIWLISSNAFIYFGFIYNLLELNPIAQNYLGFFTLSNALIHFLVAFIVFKKKLADKQLFYFINGLVLIFVSLAVPVQLDGNWVTLFWVTKAALLFYIGRRHAVAFYEKSAYSLMIISFFSLLHDWDATYNVYFNDSTEGQLLFLNIHFLSSMIFVFAFGFINFISFRYRQTVTVFNHQILSKFFKFAIPSLFLIATYFAIYHEISNYYFIKFIKSKIEIVSNGNEMAKSFFNDDYLALRHIQLSNYSFIFLIILTYLNRIKFKNSTLNILIYILTILQILIFLDSGLLSLSELRINYLEQTYSQYYKHGLMPVLLRYLSFALISVLYYLVYRLIESEDRQFDIKKSRDIVMHGTVIWLLSNEWMHCSELLAWQDAYKLSLSIVWGLYALFLIVLGIWKKKNHIRFLAIVIFSATLIKLFFYDTTHLDTISKTILFVALGILLLIVSFLYTKYKDKIFNEND